MHESAGYDAHYSQGPRREVLGAVLRAGCAMGPSHPRALGAAACSCRCCQSWEKEFGLFGPIFYSGSVMVNQISTASPRTSR